MEVWKDLPGYEGHYKISNIGGVKTLDRHVNHGQGGLRKLKGKRPKLTQNKLGYFGLRLSLGGKSRYKEVHQLVAITFLNHKPCGSKLVVDHINNKPWDNRVENLQLLTNGANTCKGKSTYPYIRVVKGGSYRVGKNIDGVVYNVGCFKNIEDAKNAQNTFKIQKNM